MTSCEVFSRDLRASFCSRASLHKRFLSSRVGFGYLFDTGFVLWGTKLELIIVELFPWHAWVAYKDSFVWPYLVRERDSSASSVN